MWGNSEGLISATINRSYMKAIRDLLGFNQYTLIKYFMKDSRIIRESQVSAIEGKIGYSELWPVYADCIRKRINAEKDHTEDTKEIMLRLLEKWERA